MIISFSFSLNVKGLTVTQYLLVYEKILDGLEGMKKEVESKSRYLPTTFHL